MLINFLALNAALIQYIRAEEGVPGILGWKRLEIVNSSLWENVKLIKSYSRRSVPTRASNWTQHCGRPSTFGVIIRPPDLNATIDRLKCKDPFTTLVLCSNCSQDVEELMLELKEESLAFYLRDADLDDVYVMQSFKGQNVVAKYPLSGEIDLSGAAISMVNANWLPYFELFHCDRDRNDCEHRGIFSEIIRLLAVKYNFTVKVDYRDWGVIDAASESSILYQISEAKYDFSPGPWIYMTERLERVDMTRIPQISYRRFAANLKSSPYDLSLFSRPFSKYAWIGMSLCLSAIFCCHFLTSAVSRSIWARRILLFCAGILFVLLMAFYGGALTMFLSTAPDLPFSRFEEALESYPAWKLFIVTDAIAYLKQNIPLYRETLERIMANYDTFSVDSLSGAVEKMKNGDPGWFCYIDSNRINYHLTLHPAERDFLNIFGPKSKLFWYSLLPKKSPHGKMFNEGLLWVQRTGINDRIFEKWIRSRESEGQIAVSKVLNFGHVSLAFLLLFASIVICSIILCFEVFIMRK